MLLLPDRSTSRVCIGAFYRIEKLTRVFKEIFGESEASDRKDDDNATSRCQIAAAVAAVYKNWSCGADSSTEELNKLLQDDCNKSEV